MCTLIVLHRCVPGRPLVVAANRDEFLDRPAEGMALRSGGTGSFIAPLDLEAGGTWVGLNARGVFVGLTNLRPATDVGEETKSPQAATDDSTRSGPSIDQEITLCSRGEVVVQALSAESADAAMQSLRDLAPDTFNPFQLLVADGQNAFLMVYRGVGRAIALEPGPHIVGNVIDSQIEARLGTAAIETRGAENRIAGQAASVVSQPRLRKLTRIRERVEKLVTESGQDLFEGLAGICREHLQQAGEADTRVWEEELDRAEQGLSSPFESTCVHVADRYGTRSSLLLELAADPDASRLWTTEGPPCQWPYEDRSSLLRELGVRPGIRAETETTKPKKRKNH